MNNQSKEDREFDRALTCMGSLCIAFGVFCFLMGYEEHAYKGIVVPIGVSLIYMGNYILHRPQ